MAERQSLMTVEERLEPEQVAVARGISKNDLPRPQASAALRASTDRVQPQTYSVTVSFRGTGLDVDVVPILYDGDAQWYGNLVSQDDGSLLKTSIPLHLDFASKRKRAQEEHFAQVVRLAKFWARRMKQERDGFRFKSFMIEMVLAKLCDDGHSDVGRIDVPTV